ncbi:Zn(II)2Cys6 transcription factor [Aspergillus clavatus NRRL 1]|uniref:C6 zinc finger domain protein n=1 Tax=Aspergillus clavatus (strain ATCC 1007 / CBS 513.65 / DSM 816 / NCTC 3887 / NRRL 1 / QM 1276 / 107) TaxID=344612 RepID=A1C8P5_ASPCL|nr:C6 zinc finger domain protein [Aspergillus clavatus NRRL 1]EAW13682.1 C6 zinc finger domain protein [Aspergillus clavatus NRRL 1]
MGGSRGKSHGCGTCRARKIACGRERPSCTQCIKARRFCTGYHREVGFILVQPGTKASRRDANVHATPETGPSFDIIRSSHMRQSFLEQFVGRCLPHPHLINAPKKPWLLLLPNLPMRTKALEFSALALSCAGLGRKAKDQSLLHQSLRSYTRGLRELQAALWDQRLMHDDETLAACLVLSLYEVIECPDRGCAAYISHCKGFVSLIKARGMDAHTAGIGHELFLGVRFPGILDALGHRVPNYLCDRAWCLNPWSTRSKKSVDRIADCLAGVPFILQRLDRLDSLDQMENVAMTRQLIEEAYAIDRALQDVYSNFQLEVPGLSYWPVLSQSFTGNETNGAVFPVVYHFPNLKTASFLMLYWASRALLWSCISNLNDIIRKQTTQFTIDADQLSLDGHKTYTTMARNVCQSLEYCLQEELSLLGMFVASTPIAIVTRAVQNRTEERDAIWLIYIQEKMRQGLQLWQYI